MVIIKKIRVLFLSILLLILPVVEINNKSNIDNNFNNNLNLTAQEEYLIFEELEIVPSKNTLKTSAYNVDTSENKIYNNLSNNGGRVQLYEDQFGTKLDGYDYDVILPDGVPTVEAPNVIGMTFEEANNWSLLNLNRNITIFDNGCYGSNFAPGTIAKQSPAAGYLIPNDYNPETTSSLTAGLTVWIQLSNCEELISE